jgi:hypothetical protein
MRSRSVPSVLRTIAIFIASLQAARAGGVNAAEARGLGAPLYQRAVQANAVHPAPPLLRRQYSLQLAHEDAAGQQAAFPVLETYAVPVVSSDTVLHEHAAPKAAAGFSSGTNPLVAESYASPAGRHRSGLPATKLALMALPGASRARAPCPSPFL